eukprot:1354285-Amorphochlora_amoeboformis.AAC.1
MHECSGHQIPLKRKSAFISPSPQMAGKCHVGLVFADKKLPMAIVFFGWMCASVLNLESITDTASAESWAKMILRDMALLARSCQVVRHILPSQAPWGVAGIEA